MSSTDKKPHCPLKIYARQRPMSRAEVDQKCGNIVQNITPREIQLKLGFTEKRYNFDYVFGEQATQFDVYNVVVSPMINSVLAGHNCTVFAYGQTGSGKTYTMFGDTKPDIQPDNTKENTIGIIPRAAHHLFTELSKFPLKLEHTVHISLVEIYNEEIRDLFNQSTPLRIYDDPLSKGSVCIKDMSKVTVVGTSEVYHWLNSALAERQNAATYSNLQSTCSHLLFTFVVNIREVNSKGEEIIRTGRLQLLDLAGTENAGRLRATNVKPREAETLNRSLITLAKVIKAVSQKLQHVPYRDSKLTRILHNSLGGNSRTAMIATFSPSSTNWDETINNLELTYAARSIVNTPQVNVSKKQANLLQELHDEVTKLKAELSASRKGEGFYVSADTYDKMNADLESANKSILEAVKYFKQLEQNDRDLDMKSRNLNESVMKIKENLEEIKKRLHERKEEGKLYAKNVKENMEGLRRLTTDTTILRDVCDKSTRNEEIFYTKFQDKCTANLNNVEQFTKMMDTSQQSLEQIAAMSRARLEHLSGQVGDLRGTSAFMQYQHLKDLNRMNDLFSEINTRAQECSLDMEELAAEFSRNDTCEFITNIFDDRRSHIEAQEGIRDSLEQLKSAVEINWTGPQEESQEVLSAIDDYLNQKQDSFAVSAQFIQNLSGTVEEQERQNLAKQKEQEEIMNFLSNQIIECDREDEEIIAITSKMEGAASTARRFLDDSMYFEPIDKVERTISHFMESCEAALQSQRAVIDQVMEDINEQESDMCDQISADVKHSSEYVQNLTGTVNAQLSENSHEFRNTLQDWEKAIEEIHEPVMKMAIAKTTAAENTLVELSENEKEAHGALKQFIQNAIAAIKSFSEKVIALGHKGDTPARQSYVLPKRFANRPSTSRASLEPVNFEEDDSDKENNSALEN